MSKRSDRLLLLDIQSSIIKISDYCANMDYQDFEQDPKTADAVIRNLEIIGEATIRLRDGWYTEEPPFDSVLLNLDEDEIVVGCEEVTFGIAPISSM